MAHSNNKVVRYDATRYNFFDGSEYSNTHGYNDENETFLIDGQKKILPKSVVKLMEIIFDKKLIKKFLENNSKEIELLDDLKNIAVEIFPTSVIDLFNSVKSSVWDEAKELVLDTSEIFLPHSVTKNLDYLFWIQEAQAIIQEFDNDPNPIYKYYERLKVDIRPLEKHCNEYDKIANYVYNSHGPTHTEYKLKIIEIFKISRHGEFEKFKKLDNRKLLWHGSRTTNFASILSKGLRRAPGQAKKTGSMFGEGIYFADCITKSANYCGIDKNNPIGLVLLAEVALGETYKLTKNENIIELPDGKNSVEASGKIQPDPKYHENSKSGAQIPCGPLINFNIDSSLQYNEYVIYDPKQILLKYLIQLEFCYK